MRKTKDAVTVFYCTYSTPIRRNPFYVTNRVDLVRGHHTQQREATLFLASTPAIERSSYEENKGREEEFEEQPWMRRKLKED